MKIVVLDAATLGKDLSLTPLHSLGEVTVYPKTDPSLLAERLADCEVAILNKIQITKELVQSLPKLQLICVTATGYDNIDINACRACGVAVCNVKGYSTNSVAQVTLSIALSLFTHLEPYREWVRSGNYRNAGIQNALEPVFHEIAGKTWGIIGLGNIGRQVARVAEAMGCRVVCTSRTPKREYENLSLNELCAVSDIISLHLPLTEQTKGCIGKEQLALMKPDAILINVARGALLNEEAVVEAIEQGRLGGFGTDVYAPEPLSAESPLNRILNRENVIATPHMAWGAFEARTRCIDQIVQNILAFQAGEEHNRVDLTERI